MDSKKKRQSKVAKFLRQDGKCYWCGRDMVLTFAKKHGRRGDLATFEHLVSRISEERGKRSSAARVVLACRRCNNARGAQEYESLPISERRERAGMFPLGTYCSIETGELVLHEKGE